jgi:hypothetical protein
MHVVRFAETEVPTGLRTQALALQDQAWPSDPGEADDVAYDPAHDPALQPYCLLLLDSSTPTTPSWPHSTCSPRSSSMRASAGSPAD